MMPINYLLRKCTGEYKLSKSQEKIDHLMNTDDIKLFAKNEKELETLIQAVRIYSMDNRDGTWDRKMRHVSDEMWETTHDGRYGTIKSRKN